MPVPATPRYYLVEWYQPELTAESLDTLAARLDAGIEGLTTDGLTVRLLAAFSVPTDEVLYGVFAADTRELVAAACRRAGIPVQRLSPDVAVLLTQTR